MAAKKTSDAAAAAAEAAMALELETAAAAAAVAVASTEAQQEAEAAAVRLQKQQQQDELDVVAVGAVAHVIRRAFHTFYAYPEAEDHTTGASDADAATLADFEPLQVSEGPVEGSKQDEAQAQDKSPQDEPQVQEKVEKRYMREMELSPFVALAQSRKDAIAKQLEHKHERARALLQFMDERQRQAAEADAQITELLSQRGLVVKAQIPVGPSHLKLDEQELRTVTDTGTDFGEFADALLHAKTLVAEYEQRRKAMSGNMNQVLASPTRRTAAGEGSGENGDQVGYLGTTTSSSIRKGATLEQHKNHIAGVKVAHAEHRAATTAEKTSPPKDGMNQDGDNVPDLTATTLTPLSTTLLEQQQLQGLKQTMNPIEKRKNMAILERMQTKLDFVRNPRYAVPVQTNTRKDNVEEDLEDGRQQWARYYQKTVGDWTQASLNVLVVIV